MQIYVDFISGRVFQFDIDSTPPTNYPYVAGQNIAAVTLGNTTVSTKLASVTIPAGALKIGDSVKVLFFATVNSSAGTKAVTINVNNTGSANAGALTMTTNTGGIMEVTFKITSLTNIRALTMTNNASYGLVTTTSPRNYTVLNINSNDFTIDIYGQKITSGTDTLILEHFAAIAQRT